MPTYDYKCNSCGYSFEFFQSMKDEPLKKCPKCKGELKRLIGAGAGPIFKGTGFYQTDYKNTSNNKSKTGSSTTTKETSTKDKTTTK